MFTSPMKVHGYRVRLVKEAVISKVRQRRCEIVTKCAKRLDQSRGTWFNNIRIVIPHLNFHFLMQTSRQHLLRFLPDIV